MPTLSRSRALAAVLALFVSVSALASVVDLEDRATVLVADYETLLVSLEACPEGDCDLREAMDAELQALELELADLESRRDDLEPCSDCQTLDALLDDAAVLAAAASEAQGGWDEFD